MSTEHELGPLPCWSRQAPTHVNYDADQMREYALSEVHKALSQQAQEIERLRAQRDGLMEAANEVLERIQCYPAYQDLTIDEEIEIGGDTAEFSYLARVLSEAIEAAHGIHPLQRLADLSKEIGEKL